MIKTALFAEMKKWRWEEIAGIFAHIFLKRHSETSKERCKAMMIEAMNAVCCKEEINEALEHLGREERID